MALAIFLRRTGLCRFEFEGALFLPDVETWKITPDGCIHCLAVTLPNANSRMVFLSLPQQIGHPPCSALVERMTS
jgi:hypothetical protein